MAKSREKVQQIGLWDDEVAKPSHDDIVLWAYRQADEIIRTLFPGEFDREWNRDDRVRYAYENSASLHQLADEFVKTTPRPNPQAGRKTLEFVLAARTGRFERTVGFADLLVEIRTPCIRLNETDDGVELGWTVGTTLPASILVEAKTVLPTVGDLMRQIQLYRTAHKGPVVVISPDDSYAGILAEQEVGFVQYLGSL